MPRKPGPTTQYTRVEPGFTEQPIDQESEQTSGSWFERHQSPIWMIASLISGVAVAAGHHFLYASYNDQRVDAVSLSQAWIVRIGTGMAFLVKTLLVIAATFAFTQNQWLTIKSRSFEVRQIDTISSVLSNPLGLFQTRAWFRQPILLLLAIITWLLPIAAIVTPATIIVVTHKEVTTQPSSPPQIYFDPVQYASLQTTVRTDYVSASANTIRAALSSGLTGEILTIPSEYANESYTLDFIAPALRCDFADASVINETYNAYLDQMTSTEYQWLYIAWVPTTSDQFDLSDTTTFLDLVSTDAAHIYIIPNTSMSAGPIYVGGSLITDEDEHFGYQDLLDCKLYNASYQAFLNFSYPAQSIEVTSRSLLNPVNVSTDISEWYYSTLRDSSNTNERQAQRVCYQAIMETLGRLLVGNEWLRDGYTVTAQTSWSMMSINWTDRVAAQQGVEELFQNITFSMMSSAALTMNSSIAAQNQVPIDIYSNFNIYSYHPEDLWLAYGIAAGFTLLCTSLGLYAIWRNDGASYQNVFSTYVRKTHQHQTLQESIDLYDNGAEPLPRNLARTQLVLGIEKQD